MNNPAAVRTISLFIPILFTLGLFYHHQPGKKKLAAIFMASLWVTPWTMLLHFMALHFNWWSYQAEGGLLFGFPLDLYIGWVVLWGIIPALGFISKNVVSVLAGFFILDLVIMPLANPVVQLGTNWITGEVVGIGIVLLPAMLLSRWTYQQAHLMRRVLLIGIAFSLTTLWLLPSLILETTGANWNSLTNSPPWLIGLELQILAVPVVMGLSAVQEFALRGKGTPIPMDPPKKLVTSGIYAYLANPMQSAIYLILFGIAIMTKSYWIWAAGISAIIYCAGFAKWSEDIELSAKYGQPFAEYQKNVWAWIPRWRPWIAIKEFENLPVLYIAEDCAPCSELALWLSNRNPLGLRLLAAENHPTRNLERLTYEASPEAAPEVGIKALARAMEHINLGWALLGMLMRLPVITFFLQILNDAVGGDPKPMQLKNMPPDINPLASPRLIKRSNKNE